MKRCWQLHVAKNRLSEVVDLAQREGPQVITVRGREAVVVLSVAEWQAASVRPPSLKQALRESPVRDLTNAEIDALFERQDDYGRPVEVPG
jgi:prevent-host-death family protein